MKDHALYTCARTTAITVLIYLYYIIYKYYIYLYRLVIFAPSAAIDNSYDFDNGRVLSRLGQIWSFHPTWYIPWRIHRRRNDTPFACSHDSDFSEQRIISADSKIVNSSCAAPGIGNLDTSGRYISSREDRCVYVYPIDFTFLFLCLVRIFGCSDDEEEAPIFAVQTSLCAKKWDCKRDCEEKCAPAVCWQRKKSNWESENG